MKNYLEVGKVIGTKGLRGELRIQAWCDTPDFIKNFKFLYTYGGTEKLEIISVRTQKSNAIILFKGINTIEVANRYIDKILYINRDDIKLAEGQYFIQDLIGLKVINYDNEYYYGKITDVLKTGANDVYEITNNNKSYLLPVIPDIVKSVDIISGIVKIIPIRGIFDED